MHRFWELYCMLVCWRHSLLTVHTFFIIASRCNPHTSGSELNVETLRSPFSAEFWSHWNENIKYFINEMKTFNVLFFYFIFASGNRMHNLPHLQLHVCASTPRLAYSIAITLRCTKNKFSHLFHLWHLIIFYLRNQIFKFIKLI